jgi:cell division septation protein DedD
MNKNLARGLVVLGIIILAVVLWWLFHPVGPQKGQGPAVTSKPGTAPTAATPAPQKAGPEGLPATSPVKPEAGPGAAPLQEPSPQGPKVTVPQPPPQGKKYGVLVGTYGKYPPAERMLNRLKRMGEPAFAQRDPTDSSRFQVWMGPFSSLDEAQAAAKKLRHRLRRRGTIEEIENPVPK